MIFSKSNASDYWDATTLSHALRAKKISVREMIDVHLTKRAAFQSLNAIVTATDPEKLLEEGDQAQRRLDDADTSLHLGTPITVKDVIAVAGLRLTAGSKLLKDNKSSIDAGVVHRLRRAGALVLGKTNCPEFGFGIGTSNDLFGRTYSPLGERLSPGGSSGGEAVSVATGVSLLGVGTDFGGSVRWPAQCLGILSLRPTPGRVLGTGQLIGTGRQGIDGASQLSPGSLQAAAQVPGFLARSVSDLENALNTTWLTTKSTSPFVDRLTHSSAIELTSISIGWSDGRGIGPVTDDVKAMMFDLVRNLQKDGLNTKLVPEAFLGSREAFDDLRGYEELYDLRALSFGREDELGRTSLELIANPPRSRDGLAHAKEFAHLKRLEGLEQLKQTPLFLLPVAGCGAVEHDETAEINGNKLTGFELMAHCRAISLMGAPVVSIPVAKTSDGLPLSVQVIARPFAEHIALALAKRIEVLIGGWQPIKNI